MIKLDESTSRVLEILYPLLAGLGLGMLFHAPFQVFSRVLQPTEMASGTSAFFLVRFTGATVGLVRRICHTPSRYVLLISICSLSLALYWMLV